MYDLDTVSRLIERESGGPRIMAQILGTLASGALLLAAVGIYGVLSFAVRERSYEIGIRRAIGAQSRDIWRLVWRQTATPIAIGASAGLALALALGQGVRVLLEGVSPIDPVTYATTLALLLAAALLAAWFPARRALRVDPLRVLRAE